MKLKLQIVEEINNTMKGRLEQSKIDEICQEFILSYEQGFYSATVDITSYILKNYVTVTLDTGRKYEGNGDALGTPGKGHYWVKLYTKDYKRLLDQTTSYWCSSNLTLVSVLFFDRYNSLLGSCVGAGVSSIVSANTGKGLWDNIE
ncbi:hypothetical protein Xbed_02038 [Xenorhabdus beddingii]|uniref:Uncharacterized protein n=1 Tax=Xenorhabdus beddingii TaxID=40578 RepID=A0A1Y2SLG1_9GAMM|nr:VapA/VapB family virulence-associated protein [Xenorhabdus beddingii]OTA19730.1 hypothetical protein Xbed_02038 [Xenorhabdus beddingii]